MPFEPGQFPNSGATNNHYGPRDTEKTVGNVKTEGRTYEASLEVDVETIANGGPVLVDLVIPATSIIEEAYADVSEVFTVTGTTPTILVGTDTSEVTNGFVVSEAQAEAVGTYDLTSTLTGTWAAPLAADTTIGITLGGTTPVLVGALGKIKFIIKYTLVA